MKAPIDSPQFVERSLQQIPDYVFRSERSRLAVARWHHPACELSTHSMVDHVLVHHLSGSTRIERRSSGRVTGSHSKLGSSTFVSCHHPTEWRVAGEAQVMHLYIPPTVLSEYAAEELESDDAPEIHEFFASEDSWLTGFFGMLCAEAEQHGYATVSQDAFLLEQLELVLCRHLIRHYASDTHRHGIRALDRLQGKATLSPNRLNRIVAFMEENYARQVGLSDMSELVCMSRDHFVRAFRNAVGQTPYQYLLSLRLTRARQLLLDHREWPVAEIATLSGFRNAGHFSTTFSKSFKCSPSRYRASSG